MQTGGGPGTSVRGAGCSRPPPSRGLPASSVSGSGLSLRAPPRARRRARGQPRSRGPSDPPQAPWLRALTRAAPACPPRGPPGGRDLLAGRVRAALRSARTLPSKASDARRSCAGCARRRSASPCSRSSPARDQPQRRSRPCDVGFQDSQVCYSRRDWNSAASASCEPPLLGYTQRDSNPAAGTPPPAPRAPHPPPRTSDQRLAASAAASP